ncbi:MAG: hypothetical protein F6K03_15870 [Kamptonema sp. SIO4C4]|nr:hypothetical protein [Kamptonema sp. SIO4C4]
MSPVSREIIKQKIDQLDDEQLQKIAEYIDNLQGRNQSPQILKSHRKFPPSTNNWPEWASLYQEFTQEARELAELGMADYTDQLQKEDW